MRTQGCGSRPFSCRCCRSYHCIGNSFSGITKKGQGHLEVAPNRCGTDATQTSAMRFVSAVQRTLQQRGSPKPLQLTDRREIEGGLSLSPLGIGTWAWGNKLLWGYSTGMDEELRDVFNLLVAAGVNVFDTADSYGTGLLNGRSELLLGRFTRSNAAVAAGEREVHIATKLAGYPWRVTPWNMAAACRGSLRRLQAEKVAIAQLHWSAAKYAPLQEAAMVRGLGDCYEQGLCRAVGVSNYGPQQLQKVYGQLAGRGIPLATAQVQISLLSWGPLQRELVAVAAGLGIAVFAYSPLCLGLLTGKYGAAAAERLPPGPRGALFRQLLPSAAPVLGALRAIADERGKSMSQVAINWAACKGCIPIPGVKTLAMAEDNMGAMGWRLTDGEEEELDVAAASVSRGMIQNIFQTK